MTRGSLVKYFILGISLFVFTACSNYSVFLNDNALYQPPALYLNFSVPDSQLENCIVQHIEDMEITTPRDLKQLNCSYGGIQNLQGLVQFSRLETLSLKGNPLINIEAIPQLVNLQILDISETNITCEKLTSLQTLPLDQLISSEGC